MKRKRVTALQVFAILLAFLACSVVCSAADKAPDKPADNMQILAEKIKADKKLLVSENMQLTEKEAKAFWPVYGQYQDELFLIRIRMLDLISDYAAAYQSMTGAKARKLLDESLTIESLYVKLRAAYVQKFRKALSDEKVARYYQIENKINAALMYDLARSIPLVKQ